MTLLVSEKYCSECGSKMEMKLDSGFFIWFCVHCGHNLLCKKGEEPRVVEEDQYV